MSVPSSLRPIFESLPPAVQISVRRDYDARAKSTLFAYIAWFLLGWHYLYLKRTGLQIAFWLTAGGFGIWWLVDFFRVHGMVRKLNEDLARELMVQYKSLTA
ncbi:MAG: TM2 domain-containing protein [Verrucomicrobiota bacterium]